MNNLTVFLSQIIGPLFLIIGVALILNKKYYVAWFKRLDKESEAFLFIVSVIEFIAGMVIILQHNLWGNLVEGVISLIGWCMVIEGALIMLAGKSYEKWVLGLFRKTLSGATIISAIVCIALGIYMIWFGFLA